MVIDLLYVAGCPHRMPTRDHLYRALSQLGRAVTVREREVRTSEEAVQLGMRGSPTVLIDGVDPFSAFAGPLSLSCRLYRAEGCANAAPTVAQLRAALESR